MPSRALVLAVLLSAFIAHPASPSGLEGTWSHEFAIPGLDDAPIVALSFHGDVIVAGLFLAAGGQQVHGIARWDGSAWHPMGEGFDGTVYALAEWRGRLVAGGHFSTSRVHTGPLALWNGAEWEPLGIGIEGEVMGLATTDSSLVVQGNFTIGDADAGARVARWTGDAWDTMAGGADGYVGSIESYAGGVAVGGQFQHAGGVPAANIALWRTGAWSAIGAGVHDSDGAPIVYALGAFGSDLLAWGVFDSAGTAVVPNFARWNGSAWSSVPGATEPLKVFGMTDVGDHLAICGWGPRVGSPSWNYVASWDGVTFAADTIRLDYPATAFAGTPGTLVMTGLFTRVNGLRMPYIAVRANGTWRPAFDWHTGMHGLGGHAVGLAEYRSSLFAIGDFTAAGDDTGWVTTPGVARWDGSRWWPAGQLEPTREGELRVFGDSLYAANGHVLRWNGADWGLHGAPQGMGINHLEWFAGTLWGMARCDFGCADKDNGGLYQLVGGAWTPVTPPADLDTVSCFPTAMRVSGGALVVAWATSGPTWANPTRLYAHNGAHWGASLGEFTGGDVTDLATFRGQLCASGGFESVNGDPMPGFAAHAPAGWSALGHPGQLFGTMVANDSLLFVSGTGLWAFDGANWSAFAPEPTFAAASLLLTERSLWAGGFFRTVGSASSEGIARFDFANVPATAALSHVVAAPNPSRAAVALQFTLARAGRVRVTILDLSGRRVATPVDGFIVAGAHTLSWSGRDDHGRSLPAGLYFARVEPEGVAANTQRIVRVP